MIPGTIPNKDEVMGTPYTFEGEGDELMKLYTEYEVREIMDKWGRIKWEQAQHDAMEFRKNTKSISPLKYPIGTFTPYKK
jgi:hypothetical protein